MTRRPDTKYAWNGDVALAYQVFGEGPVDLFYLQGFVSHVDLNWESPYLSRFLTALGQMARVIHTDRRGWGCSERFSPGDIAPLEAQVDDIGVVMDAAGSDRAVLFGSGDTVCTVVLFAATYPERAAGLVLADPILAYYDSEESRRKWAEMNEDVRRNWGTPEWQGAEIQALPGFDQREYLDWYLPWCRASAAPGALAAESDAFAAVDVRDVLPAIHAPALVVGNDKPDGEWALASKDLAARLPGARHIEPPVWPGANFEHWYARGPATLDAVRELIASIREEQATFDRVLATVLFSDIVDSTAVAARLGDTGWRGLVERHHAIVRGLLARYRGKEADTAGDGFFATFDGPARAVTCAKAIVEAVRPLEIEVRVGVHTGEVETIDGKAGGLAVVIGSRIGALARASEVLTTQTVKDLTVGSGLHFEDAGEHELKGVPDRWRLYRVAAGQPRPSERGRGLRGSQRSVGGRSRRPRCRLPRR